MKEGNGNGRGKAGRGSGKERDRALIRLKSRGEVKRCSVARHMLITRNANGKRMVEIMSYRR